VEQDPLLEPLQARRRVQSQLLDEQLPEPLIGPERLGVAPGTVQRQHQNLARPLAKRILPDRRFGERQGIGHLARRELRGGELLDGVEVPIGEAPDVRLGKLLVGKVGQRRPAPQRERGPKPLRSTDPVASPEALQALLDQALEPPGVDRVVGRLQLVSGLAGDDDLAGHERGQRLAQLRDVDLDRVPRRARRVLGPQCVDELVNGDDLTGVQQQDREQRPLLGRAELGRDPAGHGLE
jgi:hypothetical protein